MKRHFLMGDRGEGEGGGNYASLDYIHRMQEIQGAGGEIKGMLIEWGEIRTADDCFQTLPEIQTQTNSTQQLLGRQKTSAEHPHAKEDQKS